MPACMYVWPSVCLSICLSVCLFVCLGVCVFVYVCLYLCLSFRLSVCHSDQDFIKLSETRISKLHFPILFSAIAPFPDDSISFFHMKKRPAIKNGGYKQFLLYSHCCSFQTLMKIRQSLFFSLYLRVNIYIYI